MSREIINLLEDLDYEIYSVGLQENTKDDINNAIFFLDKFTKIIDRFGANNLGNNVVITDNKILKTLQDILLKVSKIVKPYQLFTFIADLAAVVSRIRSGETDAHGLRTSIERVSKKLASFMVSAYNTAPNNRSTFEDVEPEDDTEEDIEDLEEGKVFNAIKGLAREAGKQATKNYVNTKIHNTKFRAKQNIEAVKKRAEEAGAGVTVSKLDAAIHFGGKAKELKDKYGSKKKIKKEVRKEVEGKIYRSLPPGVRQGIGAAKFAKKVYKNYVAGKKRRNEA